MTQIHVDVKTRYSVRRGLSSSKDLVAQCEPGDVLAITDKESLGGWYEHEDACRAKGVKPLFGVEVDVASCGPLVLLCEDQSGVESLYRLARHMPERLTYQHLSEHSAGLIALTGHLSGAIPTALLSRDPASLKLHMNTLLSIFGKDRLYLEQVDWGMAIQAEVNAGLELLSKKTGVPCVMAQDVRYARAEQWMGHALMVCDDLKVMSSVEQLREFGTNKACVRPVARSSALEQIAERCNASVPKSKPLLPRLTDDDAAELEAKAYAGLLDRFAGSPPASYVERFAYEMSVIRKTGFASYFLVVSDFVGWAHSQGIRVGAGRGSGAGSLVGWCCRITEIDPVRHNLYFERFLNPERVSIPDYDIDFCAHRREEVIAYLYKRWGHAKVVGIAAYGEYKLKEAWKAACRVLDISAVRANDFSKRYMERATSFEELVLNETMMIELDRHRDMKEALEASQDLLGAYKAKGHHPGGTVVLDRPAHEALPVDRFGICMFDKDQIERAGGVKYDILGVKELTSLEYANANLDYRYDINNLPENDPKSLELLQSGSKLGIFQVGKAMSGFVEEFRPDRDEDVALIIALRRPGPMDAKMDTECAKRKNGQLEVVYAHDDLEQILGDTYGVMAYQEQVMLIGQKIAGMTMGGADVMRRAIGKKNMELLMKQREAFIKGGEERGYDEVLLCELWELIEKFAGYGFNRAHAAGYAKLVLQTAYFKAHHFAEFMAAQCRVRGEDHAELALYLREIRAQVHVVWPDVNKSLEHFYAKQDVVHYGLSALRGIGQEAASQIVQGAPYADLEDFMVRSHASKSQLESLLCAGALDGLFDEPELDDAMRGVIYPRVMGRVAKLNKLSDTKRRQGFLFGRDPAYAWKTMPEKEVWTPWQVALKRFEMMASWGAVHPLAWYTMAIEKLRMSGARVCFLDELAKHVTYTVQVAVVVKEVVSIQKLNARGEHVEYARLVIEDQTGAAEVMWFRDVDFAAIPKDGPARMWLNVDWYDERISCVVVRVEALKGA